MVPADSGQRLLFSSIYLFSGYGKYAIIRNARSFSPVGHFPALENALFLEIVAIEVTAASQRAMISETEMLKQLQRGVEFPPVAVRLVQTGSRDGDEEIDAILEVRAGEQSYQFAAEMRARSTPRAFEEALRRIERIVQGTSYYPMLVTPYLREAQLEELQQQQVSGIDLSGNGVITIPGKLFVYRTGKPNKFPDSAPTKYAYRGATSLVARVFLCRKAFDSLADIKEEIQARGGSVAFRPFRRPSSGSNRI